MNNTDCCILNAGGGAWAFEPLARQLSRALWVDIAEQPRGYNYLLLADDAVAAGLDGLFIPLRAIEAAADKRELARIFATAGVPVPDTRLVESADGARRFADAHPNKAWCLKYP